MTESQPNRCNDSVRHSIPWFVNGTLSDVEAALVQKHIDGCSDCRADVELHAGMRESVLGREVTPIMPKTTSADILSGDTAGRSHSMPSYGVTRRRVAIAAGLAVLGVALIMSMFADRRIENTNQQFETATSEEAATNIDYVLQLRFGADVSEQRRGEIVAQLADVVKWTTAPGGDYEIHVRLSAPSLLALEQYQERAESIAGVQSAEFTALQLPMR